MEMETSGRIQFLDVLVIRKAHCSVGHRMHRKPTPYNLFPIQRHARNCKTRSDYVEQAIMIGAMPAVAVRHERRKGQEKRSKRPSQLYIGGHWLPPTSPSPTPSPNGPNDDGTDRLPELYICGKVSALQLVVGSILLGAIVLIVGLVQLVPNAADADHRYFFIGAGSILLLLGFILTAVRCFCMHCARNSRVVMEDPPPPLDAVNSIDVLVQRRDTQVTSPSELDSLIAPSSQTIDKENICSDT